MAKLFRIRLNDSWLLELALGAGKPETISVHHCPDPMGHWTSMEAVPVLYGLQHVAGLPVIIRSVQPMSSTELTVRLHESRL